MCKSYNLYYYYYPFQEQLKESNQSFVFRLQVYIYLSLASFCCTRWLMIERLQVADNSALYGCCVLVEEIVQRPSKLVSMLMNDKPIFPRRSRYVITTPRCYCILSRLPFFELHFGVLQRYFFFLKSSYCYLIDLPYSLYLNSDTYTNIFFVFMFNFRLVCSALTADTCNFLVA